MHTEKVIAAQHAKDINHMKYSTFLSLLMLGSVFASPAHANDTKQDLAQLEDQIAQFVDAAVGVPGGLRHPLDQRLQLARCDTPPALRMAPTLDYIIISCAVRGWQFTAPLTPLPGTSVQATVNGKPQRSFATSPAATEVVIKKGDRITLILPGEGFSMQTFATAEEDGVAGAYIRVRTAPKGPVLRAMVQGADRAIIP